MKSIGDMIKKPTPAIAKKTRGGVNSERADLVEQLCKLMNEDPKKRMKYWLGRTRKLPPAEIYRLMRLAKDGRNPAALFNHLLKNYGKK